MLYNISDEKLGNTYIREKKLNMCLNQDLSRQVLRCSIIHTCDTSDVQRHDVDPPDFWIQPW